jgi:DNA processing protein
MGPLEDPELHHGREVALGKIVWADAKNGTQLGWTKGPPGAQAPDHRAQGFLSRPGAEGDDVGRKVCGEVRSIRAEVRSIRAEVRSIGGQGRGRVHPRAGCGGLRSRSKHVEACRSRTLEIEEPPVPKVPQLRARRVEYDRGVHGSNTADLLGPLNAIEQKFAPARLWTAGDASLLQQHPRVAVVGTRHPSADGQRRARRLVKALVEHGAIIVSGLALGIDTIAHTHAIALGGRTIAVVGTPIGEVFPKANALLQRRIAEEHLVVSEFTPGSAVARGNFPRRNRTMALIADASVIVEAGEGSGTLSQGWEALRLGRPLFLLRSILEAGLSWPRQMLDHGALVLTKPDDLLAVLPADDIREAVAF